MVSRGEDAHGERLEKDAAKRKLRLVDQKREGGEGSPNVKNQRAGSVCLKAKTALNKRKAGSVGLGIKAEGILIFHIRRP